MELGQPWLGSAAPAVSIALVLCALASAATAHRVQCNDPAGACGGDLEVGCLQRLGAGVLVAESGAVACASQFDAYRQCLSQLADGCGRPEALPFPDVQELEGQDPRFFLSQQGLGAITRDKIISLRDLRAYYPELDLSIDTFEAEGDVYSNITASKEGAPFFEIELSGGRFRDIVVFSPVVTDENGGSVGLSFADLPIRFPDDCFPGAEGSPYAFCVSQASPQLQYLFDVEILGQASVDAGDAVQAIRVL